MGFIKIIKRNSNKLIRAAGFLALVAVLFCLTVAAQTVKRVKFDYGESSVVFSGEVQIGQKDTYIIKLKKEQNIQIDVIWQGEDITNEPRPLLGYMIIYPNGKKVDPQGGFLQPPVNGVYKIVVSPWVDRTSYRYRIVFTRY